MDQFCESVDRITRGRRRVFLNLAHTWPWTSAIINAFAQLRLVPVPI